MLIIFCDIKGNVHIEFVLQAKQWILHSTVTFYGKCEKTCKGSAPNSVTKEPAVASQQHTIYRFFLHHEIFHQKQHDCQLPPTLLAWLVVPCGCHFDTTRVIKAELQAVLNTLTKHSFQNAFKIWQKCWEWCTHAEGDYFEDDGDQ
jgi:hypothetical protein